MDARRFQRVGELFDALIDLPESRREALLRDCVDEPDVLREVQALLRADRRGDALERHAIADREALARDGDEESEAPVGAWRITGELGRGGMGVVHAVERDLDGVVQRGALKRVLRGARSDTAVARFLRERQVLARLDHPGIARLLDGGLDGEGRPYFVMDRVVGTDVITFARGRDWRERLRLFIAICAAVAYAHRQLVVHRDIKPSNVLVTDEGDVKLLDFGIAKLLDAAPREADATATLGGPLTPRYAAPEQWRGEPVGIATDVFALGLLLHEMLTGELPRALDGFARDVSAAPLARASSVCADRDLAARLRGDLDTIIGKALEADSRLRYLSVEAMADDVARVLDHRPIQARAASRVYRARKFLRRHRVAATATAIMVVGVIAGAGVAYWQARAARAEAARAEAVTAFLVDIFERNRAGSVDTAAARRTTVAQLLQMANERILAERELPPRAKAELLGVLAKQSEGLDLDEAARGLYRSQLEQLQRAGASEDELAGVRAALPRMALVLGDYAEAIAQAKAQRRPVTAAMSDAERFAQASLRVTLATSFNRTGEYDEVPAVANEALALLDPARANDVVSVDALEQIGIAYRGLGRIEESLTYLHRAQSALGAGTDSRVLEAARIGSSIARLYARDGRAGLAEAEARRVVAMASQVQAADDRDLAYYRMDLATFIANQGRYAEALALFDSAIADLRRHVEGSNPVYLGTALYYRSGALVGQGRFEDAAHDMDEAERIWRDAQASAAMVALSHRRQAAIALGQGDYARARSLLLALVPEGERKAGDEAQARATLDVTVLRDLAGVELAAGDQASARLTLDALRAKSTTDSPRSDYNGPGLEELEAQWQWHARDAHAALETLVPVLSAQESLPHERGNAPARVRLAILQGRMLLADGDAARALSVLRAADAELAAMVGDSVWRLPGLAALAQAAGASGESDEAHRALALARAIKAAHPTVAPHLRDPLIEAERQLGAK